jgi:hypothetical protein
MPAHYSLRLDKDQRFGPARPYSAEDDPEQPITATQFRTRMLSLEDGELLTKGDCFQGEFVARQDESAEIGDQTEKEDSHRSDLN